MPNDLITRLAKAMEKVGWGTCQLPDQELLFARGGEEGERIWLGSNWTDSINAQAIIVMLDEIERRCADCSFRFGFIREEPPTRHLLVTWRDGRAGSIFHFRFTGKTRAECVAEAFIKVVGE